MRAAVDRVSGWFAQPAPAERLAVIRILTGAFATVYLCVRAPVFLALADRAPDTFEAVGVLWWLERPIADGAVVGLVVVTIVLGAAFTAGAAFRATGPVFAVLLLVLTTYRSSWGQLLWFENLLVLHVLLVGFSRAADATSLDARRRDDVAVSSTTYGWPVRVAAVVTVITYVLAGIAKLRIGGVDWMSGDTLRNHVAYSATRLDVLGATPSPLAQSFLEQRWLGTPTGVATMIIELGAPIALLGGRWRTGWVAAAWLLHLGIALLMFVVFPYPLLLVAFAPLFPLERLAWRGPRRALSGALPSGRGADGSRR
jgi:hypothetical protein